MNLQYPRSPVPAGDMDREPLGQDPLMSPEGHLGVIVMLGKVGQADPLHPLAGAVFQHPGGLLVGEMPARSANPLLQEFRVRPLFQHLRIKVAFQKNRVQRSDKGFQSREEVPQVGKNPQPSFAGLHHKGHAVGPVVGGRDGLDGNAAERKSLARPERNRPPTTGPA